MNYPLISINIPTYNSGKTFETTLKSIKDQTYQKYEIIVCDHESKDNTIELANKYNCKIINDPKKLLHSRYLAFKDSIGEIIIFIDSDMFLEKTLLERIAKAYLEDNKDMLILEEGSYNPITWVEKLTAEDKKKIHDDMELDPSKSVLLPRVFKKELLEKAFDNIPKELFDYVTVQDHAITYHECYKITKQIGYINNAIQHMEPKTIKEIYKHYYRWGKTAKESLSNLPKEYNDMFQNKLNNRITLKKILTWKFIKTSPIILAKGIGYLAGKYLT
jgi:glycosyltransferase involved in cell wall biosynthesis